MNQHIIQIYKKILIILLAIIFVCVSAFIISMNQLNEYTLKKTCASFDSRKDAQRELKNWPSLDRDHDGISCETLK